MAAVPPVIAFDLRYALFGERQDELGAGTYLLELERDGALVEIHRFMDRQPVPGQPLTLNGETWIVEHVGASPSLDFRAVIHARWHAG